jgi:hypothetical protein
LGATATNYSEQRWVLAQELANTDEVQDYRCCPINGPFLALLDSHKKTGQTERHNRLFCIAIMARPEGVEPPTAWFVVFRLKSHISLYLHTFIKLTLSNKNGLFGLIRLYLGLFGAIYWTTALVLIDQTFPE